MVFIIGSERVGEVAIRCGQFPDGQQRRAHRLARFAAARRINKAPRERLL
jgi:hypothetical protein